MSRLSKSVQISFLFLFSIVLLPLCGNAQSGNKSSIFNKKSLTASDLSAMEAELKKNGESNREINLLIRSKLDFEALFTEEYLNWYEKNGTVETDTILFTDADVYTHRRTREQTDFKIAEQKMAQRMVQIALTHNPKMGYAQFKKMIAWLPNKEKYSTKVQFKICNALPDLFVVQLGRFEYECNEMYQSDREYIPKENKSLSISLTELLRNAVKAENKHLLPAVKRIVIDFMQQTESMDFSAVSYKKLKSSSDRDAQNLLIYVTTDAVGFDDRCEAYRKTAKERGIPYVPYED